MIADSLLCWVQERYPACLGIRWHSLTRRCRVYLSSQQKSGRSRTMYLTVWHTRKASTQATTLPASPWSPRHKSASLSQQSLCFSLLSWSKPHDIVVCCFTLYSVRESSWIGELFNHAGMNAKTKLVIVDESFKALASRARRWLTAALQFGRCSYAAGFSSSG